MAQTTRLLIDMRDGCGPTSVEVPAKLFGVWAVHRPFHRMENGEPQYHDTLWAVSLHPTGYTTGCWCTLRRDAYAAAQYLSDTLPEYQTVAEVTEDAPRVIAAIGQTALRRYR